MTRIPAIRSEYESLLRELNDVQAHASRLQRQIASQGKDIRDQKDGFRLRFYISLKGR